MRSWPDPRSNPENLTPFDHLDDVPTWNPCAHHLGHAVGFHGDLRVGSATYHDVRFAISMPPWNYLWLTSLRLPDDVRLARLSDDDLAMKFLPWIVSGRALIQRAR